MPLMPKRVKYRKQSKGNRSGYATSGTELAYAFVDGKWEQRKGAQGRLTDKKLNKEFEPLPKNSPNYQFDNQKNTK